MRFIDQIITHMTDRFELNEADATRIIRTYPGIVTQGLLSESVHATATALLIANRHPALALVTSKGRQMDR